VGDGARIRSETPLIRCGNKSDEEIDGASWNNSIASDIVASMPPGFRFDEGKVAKLDVLTDGHGHVDLARSSCLELNC
jgi:hypothetical protein